MKRIQFLKPVPQKRAVSERAITDAWTIAQRTEKAAEHEKEYDTAVTTCIKRTDVAIGKVRHEDHHHEDEAK